LATALLPLSVNGSNPPATSMPSQISAQGTPIMSNSPRIALPCRPWECTRYVQLSSSLQRTSRHLFNVEWLHTSDHQETMRYDVALRRRRWLCAWAKKQTIKARLILSRSSLEHFPLSFKLSRTNMFSKLSVVVTSVLIVSTAQPMSSQTNQTH
jgi:hypothetical protein